VGGGPLLSLGDFLEGAVFFALAVGCAAAVGAVMVRRLSPELEGLERALAWALWFTAGLIAEHLLPMALGILTRGTVAVASLLVLAAALALPARDRAALAPRFAAPRGARVVRVCAALAGVLAGGAALALLVKVAGVPTRSLDALNFQIPVVARWIQTGTVWRLDQYTPDYSNATYPQNGNVLLLAATLPWHSGFLTRLVAVPYAFAACAGAYACAREIGAARAWALMTAATFGAIPVFDKVALDGAQTDAPMLACLAAGALFLLRHRRTGARSDLVLAGVGLGLCFGGKWYALPAVAVVLALWGGARFVAGTRLATVLRDGALVAGLVLVAGGFWLVRNWVQTGNPLFPQKVTLLGVTVFDAPRDTLRELGGFTLAHYATDTAVWRAYLRPAFSAYLSIAALVLAAGGLLALRRRGPALVVALAMASLAVVYVMTPYSAFGPDGHPLLAGVSTRYGLPALLAAAVAAAWAGSRLPRAAQGAFALLLLFGLFDGLHKEYDPAVSGAALLAGAVGAVALAWAARRRWPAPALCAVVAVGALLGADAVRTRSNDRGYGAMDPTLAWVGAHASSGHRIGLAGIWSNDGVSPVLPVFGTRFGNEVDYVGRFVGHMLRQEPGEAPFRAHLRAGRYDLLLVGRGDPPKGPAREEAWGRAEGFREVAASQRLALLAR
jgi:hypothetical protein